MNTFAINAAAIGGGVQLVAGPPAAGQGDIVTQGYWSRYFISQGYFPASALLPAGDIVTQGYWSRLPIPQGYGVTQQALSLTTTESLLLTESLYRVFGGYRSVVDDVLLTEQLIGYLQEFRLTSDLVDVQSVLSQLISGYRSVLDDVLLIEEIAWERRVLLPPFPIIPPLPAIAPSLTDTRSVVLSVGDTRSVVIPEGDTRSVVMPVADARANVIPEGDTRSVVMPTDDVRTVTL